MDQRYGAWARLLALFRLVHDGGGHGAMRVPPREGDLFDPDRYPFLEGRPWGTRRVVGEPVTAPRVSDGVVWRVLEHLCVLDGERLSYRALDVEQIGSVYEAMMGFALVETRGRSVALRPTQVVVDLDALLAATAPERLRTLDDAGAAVTGKTAEAVAAATTVDALAAALHRRLSASTPVPLPAGALVLQPADERRRSGSHCTPRALTEPIVRTTLRPILAALGDRPRPEAILALKVCDPAMGSGAQAAPRGISRQRGPGGALLPARVRAAARGGGVRPRRDEHDRAGRHARPDCARSGPRVA